MSSSSSVMKKLGVFSVVMITVGSVDSIRNLPASALLGSHLLSLYCIAALLFFLPAALVSAELGSSDTQRGGIFGWVNYAFGPKAGLLAVWFQWTENLFWYPTILSFIAASIGYLIAPQLASNKLFICSVVISVFWAVTLVNLCGIEISAIVASICTMLGLIVPMLVVIVMGVVWWHAGRTIHISLNWHSIWPNFHDQAMWTSLNAVILSLMGIEVATVHSDSVNNPKRTYPLAIGISGLILLLTLICGSLSIAAAVPHSKISPLYGIVQDLSLFFSTYHLQYWTPFIVAMVVIGVVGSVNNWVIAPTTGLRYAAQQGCLPMRFAASNKLGAPKFLLILQAVIVTFIAFVFMLMPSVTQSYWLLTAMATQQYSLMYLLMFSAGIKQRYMSDKNHHGYQIPGGNKVMWLVAGMGFVTTLFVIAIGFVPPGSAKVNSVLLYESLLILGMLLLVTPAFVLFSWAQNKTSA